VANEVVLSDTRFYSIGNSPQIFLSIQIGNMDPGGSTVSLENAVIHQPAGNAQNLPVPQQPGNLKNTLLTCVTKVKDINPNTNKTVVTYTLNGGMSTQTYTFSIDVNQNGGYAIYDMTFVLT
jgi:hypothetical protein